MSGLLVNIPDADDQQIVSEMLEIEGCELGVIAEMATDPQKLSNFGFSPEVISRAQSLAESNSDEKPEFPVVRVEEGWSNNKRLWTGTELANIAEQVNVLEPVGHWGHIKPENIGWEAPDPQTTWVGAIVKDESSQVKERKGQMVKVFYAAGYNLPGAKVRTYIKSRAVKGISWLGFGREVPVPGKGVEIREYKLKALDWARKLAEGMPTSSIAAIASEQNEGGMMGELALAAVTPEQFEKENPNGYKLIVAKATAEADQRIAEMEGKVKDKDKLEELLANVRKTLGIAEDADPLAAIAALVTRVGAAAGELRDKLLAKELLKRIPGDDDDAKRQRDLVLRLMPQAEMMKKIEDAKDEEDAEKLIGEMVEHEFNTDDQVKFLVGEMAPPVVRRRDELKGGKGNKDTKDNAYIVES